MKTLFKIGVPWLISLGAIFYVGFHLGSKNGEETLSSSKSGLKEAPSNKSPLPAEELVTFTPNLESEIDLKAKVIQSSPTLPPNLQRIMQVEILGTTAPTWTQCVPWIDPMWIWWSKHLRNF